MSPSQGKSGGGGARLSHNHNSKRKLTSYRHSRSPSHPSSTHNERLRSFLGHHGGYSFERDHGPWHGCHEDAPRTYATDGHSSDSSRLAAGVFRLRSSKWCVVERETSGVSKSSWPRSYRLTHLLLLLVSFFLPIIRVQVLCRWSANRLQS